MNKIPEIDHIINVSVSKLTPHPQNEKLLPRLTQDELKRLKERILRYGFTEPIEITTDGVVLDGNNRVFRILISNKDEFEEAGIFVQKIPARVIDIPEDEEADYIVSKNADRRQLSKLVLSYIRGKEYNNKKMQGQRRDLTSHQNDEKLKTSEILAIKYSLASATIERDGRFTKLCDKLSNITSQDFLFALLNGEIKANKSLIQKLAKSSGNVIERVYKHYKNESNYDDNLKDVMDKIQKSDKDQSNGKKDEWKEEKIKIRTKYEEKIRLIAEEKGVSKVEVIDELLKKALEI